MALEKQRVLSGVMALAVAAVFSCGTAWAQQRPFRVEEASIADIHNAIQSGETTCRQVVEAYLERAKAYNGVCTALVTRDGAPVPASKGVMRAGAPIAYPIETVPVSKFFPDFDQYEGPAFEFGQMEPSVSDPSAYLQTGMRAGIPDAGQLNALETLNIRGERSITCKGDFDKAPSDGPLPDNAPAACEEFRKQPDALEWAAVLDREYGRNPDLKKMPMYCVVFSLKNWFEAKDMRSTGGNDVNFAVDFPKSDSPDIAELRKKGAIIFAVATASNVTGASASGPKKAKTVFPMGGLQFGLWGGQACNPYDTARVPRGTSNGSGVSVAANLVTCSICEQGTASCKGPASRNNIVNILTTKGVIQDGGIGNKKPGDRAGIHCKSVEDAALVLDAIKGYESEDMYTALPKGLIPEEPYSSVVVPDSAVDSKPLKGVRIGVAREYFVKHTKNDEAISDQIDQEIKTVLRDKLGAELVESADPMYPDDPAVPNMKYTFQDAFAEVLPNHLPEYFWQTTESGELEFAVPGWDVRSVDYAVALSMGKAPLSEKINLRRITEDLTVPSSPFVINKYLRLRGDERVKDWGSWVANAKFKTTSDEARAENAAADQDPRPDPDRVNYLVMRNVLRLVILKVMYENDIDVFVNPEQTTPPYVLGGAAEPEINGRASISCCTRFTAILGAPEVEVPGGYIRTTYDPQYVLSKDKKEYIEVTGTVKAQLPYPMPTSLMVWAGPGSDAYTIKVASAYEAATHHRIPPPAFGPLPVQQESSGF